MSAVILTSESLIGTPASGNIEYSGQFYGTDTNSSRAQFERLSLATAVPTTSGTSILIASSIPAWVKRITIMFNSVTLSAAGETLVQIGSGSISSTGYQSTSSSLSGAVGTSAYSTGFGMRSTNVALAGNMVLTLVTNNTWTETNNVGWAALANLNIGAGVSPTLSGALDRINLTTVAGTSTFSGGSVNLLYEG